MKKYIKLIIIVLIVGLGIFTLQDINAEDVEVTYQNGDLRCPPTIYGKNVTCKKVSASEVVLTYGSLSNDGDIQIIKRVTKTKKVGHYNVSFEITGKNVKQQESAAPTYIVVLVDASNSLAGSNYTKAQSAIRRFASTLIPDSDNGVSSYNIKLVEFGSSATTLRGMKNSNLNSYSSWPAFYENSDGIYQTYLGVYSHVNNAYSNAYDELKGLPANVNKYVVLFGDGDYFAISQISYDAATKALNYKEYLENIGTTILGIRYSNGFESEGVACTHSELVWYGMCTVCKGSKVKKSQGECSNASMASLTSSYHEEKDASKWAAQFISFAEDIKEETKVGGITTELKDQIGGEFFLTNDKGFYKYFKMNSITNNTYKTTPFEIEIDPFADPDAGPEKYWHKTNEKFTLSYSDENGDLQEIVVLDNPEVYWIPDKTELNSCYDSVQTSDVRNGTVSDEYAIYTKECVESGYKVTANISNFDTKTYKKQMGYAKTQTFKLDSNTGYKFPITVDLSTSVKCTYTFDTQKFKNENNEIDWNVDYIQEVRNLEANKCNSSEGCDQNQIKLYDKQLASLAVRKEKLNQIVKTYSNLVSNDASELDTYKNNFLNQDAIVTVTYPNLNKVDEVSLDNQEGTTIKDPWCDSNPKIEIVNGVQIPTSKSCYAEFSKTMVLEDACLSMQNGEQETCSVIKAQLDGGENYYIQRGADSGIINLRVSNAGFEQKLDFTLIKDKKNNDACSFTTDNANQGGNIIFRQIDVGDPFLKDYNREPGENFVNSKFDFEKIIHGDTWSSDKEPEYDYYLSKTNIVNINKDTMEDSANSYLGRNCYFSNDGKYLCRFTRNETDDGVTNSDYWFTTP